MLISNTTEAGYATDGTDRLDDHPPKSFPARLTQLLEGGPEILQIHHTADECARVDFLAGHQVEGTGELLGTVRERERDGQFLTDRDRGDDGLRIVTHTDTHDPRVAGCGFDDLPEHAGPADALEQHRVAAPHIRGQSRRVGQVLRAQFAPPVHRRLHPGIHHPVGAEQAGHLPPRRRGIGGHHGYPEALERDDDRAADRAAAEHQSHVAGRQVGRGHRTLPDRQRLHQRGVLAGHMRRYRQQQPLGQQHPVGEAARHARRQADGLGGLPGVEQRHGHHPRADRVPVFGLRSVVDDLRAELVPEHQAGTGVATAREDLRHVQVDAAHSARQRLREHLAGPGYRLGDLRQRHAGTACPYCPHDPAAPAS